MSFNIKNPETHKLVLELSKITGQSITKAVTEAVREKLEFEKANKSRKKGNVAKELLKISKRISKLNVQNKSDEKVTGEV